MQKILSLIDMTLDLSPEVAALAHGLLAGSDLPDAKKAGLFKTLSLIAHREPPTRSNEALAVIVALRGQSTPWAMEFKQQAWRLLASWGSKADAENALVWLDAVTGQP